MKNKIKPDILAKLRFYTTDEGGRETPLPSETQRFGCLFVYEEEETFDCFLILSNGQQINPGTTVTLLIKFLNPQMVIPNLEVGNSFKLRELRVIGEGEIIEIFQN